MKLQATSTEPTLAPVVEDRVGRTAMVGASEVRRLLPTKGRRLVGAWCFADHYGPAPTAGGGIGPHPHAGLQTVSWLLEGEMLHLDSLGAKQRIAPGQLNWMTSGRGITHAELQREGSGSIHGVQLWVALPDRARDTEPAFDHHAELPVVDDGAAAITVMVGEHGGVRHEARTFSPLVALDVAARGGSLRLPLAPEFEHAALVMTGRAHVAGAPLPIGTLRYLGMRRTELELDAEPGARVLILGGDPLREPVLMWWNFVARTHEEVVAMQRAWQAGERFGEVPDSGLPRIPAPDLG